MEYIGSLVVALFVINSANTGRFTNCFKQSVRANKHIM